MSSLCPSERRVWARHATDRKTLCLSENDTEPVLWVAVIRNISRGGICLRSKHAFEPGTVLKLDLLMGDNDDCLSVRARVLHARELLDGQWEVGCTFTAELTETELNSFLKGELSPGS
jgi:PilZ domain